MSAQWIDEPTRHSPGRRIHILLHGDREVARVYWWRSVRAWRVSVGARFVCFSPSLKFAKHSAVAEFESALHPLLGA